MTPEEYITLLYPYFSTSGDPRFTDPAIIAQMVTMSASRRPFCLDEELQNEAQAHYAAFLLDGRAAKISGADLPPGMVVRHEKQGNVEIEYVAPASGSGQNTPYAAWKALADMCGVGSIVVSNAFCGSGGAPP